MRIALISFEFPPAVAMGGIGTYASHAAHLLSQAGHEVEVFAAGAGGQPETARGVRVTRVAAANRATFRDAVVAPFVARHQARAFDVVESPEFEAEGAAVHAAAPALARVVRLHTPTYLVAELNRCQPTLAQRVRFTLGGLRRGRWAWLRDDAATVAATDRLERESALAADVVAAPCRSIRDVVVARWGLDPDRCAVSPNLFRPDPVLLTVPEPKGEPRAIFVGRLEARKGIFELARALPSVWQRHPSLRVTFVGPANPFAHRPDGTIGELRHRLGRFAANLEFTGERDRAGVATELARADIAVFPSRWENYPNVCLEAMSAARAVIGSSAGGMADMIEPGVSGLLVRPGHPRELADAMIGLLNTPARIVELGRAARQRVLDPLSGAAALHRHLAVYERAIALGRQRQAGAAPVNASAP